MDSESTDELLLEYLILAIAYDPIQALEVSSGAIRVTGRPYSEELRELSLSAIRALIRRGLAFAGEVDRQGKFTPWRGTQDDWINRIETEWRQLGSESPFLGEICWLGPTEAGLAAAASLDPPSDPKPGPSLASPDSSD